MTASLTFRHGHRYGGAVPSLGLVAANRTTIVLKSSMATGYAGVLNPLFFKDNTRMLFGDAKESLDAVLKEL